jgi:hypothetical protein
MKISTQMIAATAAVGILGLAGFGGLAYANQGQSVVAMSQNQRIAEVSDGDGEANDDAQDKQESTKLQSLAKVSPQQAQQSAEASLGGRASSVKLENEDGKTKHPNSSVRVADQGDGDGETP